MPSTIEVTYETKDGEEIVLTFPAKNDVCPECEGDGFVLCDGLRGEAFTMSEFHEQFDEEGREEYFRPGGKYDQTCPCCKGRNVVSVVDEELLTKEQKQEYNDYLDWQDEKYNLEVSDRAEREAERRMGC